MARSLLAVLLVFSWVTLSAFDVLEDLEVLVPLEIHSGAPIEEDSPPDAARTGQLANNILEWGNRIEGPYNALFELPSFELPVLIQETSRYVAKLHKLHCVFLI